jgi:hypothetical protein
LHANKNRETNLIKRRFLVVNGQSRFRLRLALQGKITYFVQ